MKAPTPVIKASFFQKKDTSVCFLTSKASYLISVSIKMILSFRILFHKPAEDPQPCKYSSP